MVNHIVMWNLKEELSEIERKEAALEVRKRLEAIAEKVSGVISLKVVFNEMSSSNRDIALISKFEDEESLKAYQISPEHIEAGKYVRAVTCERACLDYEE